MGKKRKRRPINGDGGWTGVGSLKWGSGREEVGSYKWGCPLYQRRGTREGRGLNG